MIKGKFIVTKRMQGQCIDGIKQLRGFPSLDTLSVMFIDVFNPLSGSAEVSTPDATYSQKSASCRVDMWEQIKHDWSRFSESETKAMSCVKSWFVKSIQQIEVFLTPAHQ